MANKESKQRIKLRCEESPVKMDGTMIASTPDGKKIRVRFDGPQEDLNLYAYGLKMTSHMKDKDGQPTDDTRLMASGLWWEVL